jgi:antitoxin VapB
MESVMSAKTNLFRSNRSQAVRLPRAVAFADTVHEVTILRDGPRRIIVPAEASWDDFFDAPGVDLGERLQPEATERDSF